MGNRSRSAGMPDSTPITKLYSGRFGYTPPPPSDAFLSTFPAHQQFYQRRVDEIQVLALAVLLDQPRLGKLS